MDYLFVFMIRRPPISTRTDTLVPYTTLFRSPAAGAISSVVERPVYTRKVRGSNPLSPTTLPKRRSRRGMLRRRLAAVSAGRSEENTSELQSLMRISYAVFCLQKINYSTIYYHHHHLFL